MTCCIDELTFKATSQKKKTIQWTHYSPIRLTSSQIIVERWINVSTVIYEIQCINLASYQTTRLPSVLRRFILAEEASFRVSLRQTQACNINVQQLMPEVDLGFHSWDLG